MPGFTTGVLLLCVLSVTTVLNSDSIRQEDQIPLIVEYVPHFNLATNDVKSLLSNQFVAFNIQNVKTPYANLSGFTSVNRYDGSRRA